MPMKNYAQLKLRTTTHADLMIERHLLAQEVKRQPKRYPQWMRDKLLSLSDLIDFLLAHREKERRRKWRYRTPRKSPAPITTGLATTAEGG